MSANTSIEWTSRTWNPLRGCSQVSAGCRNCYAMRMAHRYAGEGMPFEGLTKATPKGPVWTGKITLVEKALREPLTWRKPAKVFVNSMSDLFHDEVPDEFIRDVFGVMALSLRHTFQILTKRPARMNEILNDGIFFESVHQDYRVGRGGSPQEEMPWPLPNVHLGVSVEDQASADKRIPLLLQTPAAVRWVSMEPLLGPVNLAPALGGHGYAHSSSTRLDWVVVGGESGPGARPMHPDWARSLRDQCQAAGVPFFFKQWGEWGPYNGSRDRAEELAKLVNPMTLDFPVRHGKKQAGRLLDGREWNEYPVMPHA